MNVLSLFDGGSCGQVALKNLGIPITSYRASEVDKWAIKIAKKNHPDMIHIGDVRDVQASDLPQIDLILAGSPCQDLSLAGKGAGLEGERSGLFYEFLRLLIELKPKYFLLENVRMKAEYKDHISELLGVEPIEINSALVSAQNRNRLYWTNIPNVTQPDDQKIMLRDVLEDSPENYVIMSDKFTTRNRDAGCLVDSDKPKASTLSAYEYIKNGRQGDYILCDRKGKPSLCHQVGMASDIRGQDVIRRIYSADGKAPTLTTMQGGHREPKVAISDTKYRKLTVRECERLQTLPDGYCDGVSNTQAYKILGNGWTVKVIEHILKGME